MNIKKLKPHLPESVFNQLPVLIEKYKLTPLRLSHFLAQCDHESGGFKRTEENLNYSGDRLAQVFPRHFDARLARQYARNPEKIANRVYANRMANGNEASGDGWKYRGRGYIQLTGKANYTQFNKTVDDNVLENPDLVKTKYALESALWFFDSNNLWKWCDVGSSNSDVSGVTKRVNGGTNGLSERIKLFNHYYALLSQ